jgi:hypothetical protein
VIQDATQEAELTNEDMPDLQTPVFVAEEMGEGLGSGEVLLRRVQKEVRGGTMKPAFLAILYSLLISLKKIDSTPESNPQTELLPFWG